ncbi:DUF2931 family protein [Marinobacter salarius]|uniref:DUF2931 family protein n=1 Tax=Marinobacter salarius TaxID=1420917 RepID=UPI00273B7EFC|nr:DUF2931 family protein [Marinobacter salarius]MDP4530508.1 DUF2931 family protein [Marinobacter salarius]
MGNTMTTKRFTLSLFMLLLLGGCSEPTESDESWKENRGIGVVAPEHYDVWVDKFFIESFSEDIGWRRPFGIVSCCWKHPPFSRAQWQTTPEFFLIRWFSFAEQQSYETVIKLENADEISEKMEESAPFERYGEMVDRPRYNLVLGLAPGGTVVMWIMNSEENAIEVGRYESRKIETHPEHYTEITERYMRDSGEYIREHGVPLDGW